MRRKTINVALASLAAALIVSGSAWAQMTVPGSDMNYTDSRDPFDTTYPHKYPYPQASLPIYGGPAPVVTGRSAATGQLGNYCTTPVTSCVLDRAFFVGRSCSCKVPGGRVRGSVTP